MWIAVVTEARVSSIIPRVCSKTAVKMLKRKINSVWPIVYRIEHPLREVREFLICKQMKNHNTSRLDETPPNWSRMVRWNFIDKYTHIASMQRRCQKKEKRRGYPRREAEKIMRIISHQYLKLSLWRDFEKKNSRGIYRSISWKTEAGFRTRGSTTNHLHSLT